MVRENVSCVFISCKFISIVQGNKILAVRVSTVVFLDNHFTYMDN